MTGMHTAAAIFAILSGLMVLPLAKGTGRHRLVGWIYTGAMAAMVVVSIYIQEINEEGFSIFHLISLQVTMFISAGLVALVCRSRIPAWYVWHARFMLYSFVTLIVTGIAQAFDYLPFGSDIVNAIVFVQVPALVGWSLIEFVGMPRRRKKFGSYHPQVASAPESLT